MYFLGQYEQINIGSQVFHNYFQWIEQWFQWFESEMDQYKNIILSFD